MSTFPKIVKFGSSGWEPWEVPMKIKPFALALGCVSAGALLLPDGVLARAGGRDFHGANFHGANINRASINRANINRVGEVRDWRGNVGYGGWGWGAAGAAATAVGAAAAGATLYNNASCYQQQQVWNGSAYVLQTVRVC
jgi:hypothetical protein